jgi:hypothetical protein
MHDESTIVKIRDLTKYLNVKFLSAVFKCDRPDDGFVLWSRNWQPFFVRVVALLTVLIKCEFDLRLNYLKKIKKYLSSAIKISFQMGSKFFLSFRAPFCFANPDDHLNGKFWGKFTAQLKTGITGGSEQTEN